jgi:hypothetical protein
VIAACSAVLLRPNVSKSDKGIAYRVTGKGRAQQLEIAQCPYHD